MLHLDNVLLLYLLIYNLEVSFNVHSTFLQLNVIRIFTVHCSKNCFFIIPGYFLRAPDNSRFPDNSVFSVSLEGSSYRESVESILQAAIAPLKTAITLRMSRMQLSEGYLNFFFTSDDRGTGNSQPCILLCC